MQDDRILTSLCIVKNKVLCCACRIGHSITIPGEALTGNNRCIGMNSIVDRQMQCDCILTSLCVVKNKVLCRACRIGHSIPIPGKALAGNNCCIGMHSIVNCQMQCYCILTSLYIVKNKILYRACSIGHSITVPGKALAGNNCCIGMHSIVDRQM